MKTKFLSGFLFCFAVLIVSAQQQYLITGTYTSGKSEGIYVYSFNSADGSSKEISHVKISNPSFVAVSPDERFVYSVQEDAAANGKGGMITAFSFDKQKGELKYINDQSSGGDHPCYVTADHTGKWVVAGNYTGGNLFVFPVRTDGGLGKSTSFIQHTGSGPNVIRQGKAHVHCTFFSADNRFLFVPDLGMDKVMIYTFDAANGKLVPAKLPFVSSTPGAGPRHFCFHPSNKYAYLIEELSGTVVVFDYFGGRLKSKQRISTMPANDTSSAGSADIHVSADGRFLYASNRGNSNTIAIFRVNKENGKLILVGHQPVLGKTPRNFSIDPSGNFLLVANQNSDEIVVFKRNKFTGSLVETTARIPVGNPVCLKWIGIK